MKKKSSEKFEVEGAPAAYQFGLTLSKDFGGFGDLKGFNFQEA